MNDTKKPDQDAQELDERNLDEATGGTAPRKPDSIWKDGNITGADDWEKHNV